MQVPHCRDEANGFPLATYLTEEFNDVTDGFKNHRCLINFQSNAPERGKSHPLQPDHII